jgi:CRP-like cAMP-binding protein
MSSDSVMERSVIHSGKVFIKEDEENGRAYLIQAGKVRSFKMVGENKVVINEYSPGDFIGELGLLTDEPSTESYEALVDTTVAVISRQDFDHKLKKTDKLIRTVFQHLAVKLEQHNRQEQESAISSSRIDESAYQLVQALIKDMGDDNKRKYELAMMPHANALMKAIKKVRAS